MNETTNSILLNFQKKLQNIESISKDKLAEATKSIILCHRTLQDLKMAIMKTGFIDIDSEIYFFKSIKVVPQSFLYYYERVLFFETFMPPISIKQQRKFLETEITRITQFLGANSTFITYSRLRKTDLDDRYFTRPFLSDGSLVPTNGSQYDPEFNTMRDVLLAKVRANYRYMEYVNRALSGLSSSPVSIIKNPSAPLKFEGNKIDLVELIYALHAAKVFKGDPDIILIQRSVEQLFNVKLGYIYTRYQEIHSRKGERITFLPKLLTAFAELLDKYDGLEFK